MPLKYFLCPDKQKTEADVCISGKCRMRNRCAPLAFLKRAAEQRPWKGIPSTTQLLNGTRESWLIINRDYTVRPYSRAFAILGTGAHGFLDIEDEFSITEERITDDIASGQLDRCERQEDDEEWLIEWKTSGSRKIKYAAGLVAHKIPMFYPNGDKVLYKRAGKGFKVGDQKNETVWVPEGIQDCRDWILQQNRNRMLVEKAKGIKISRLKIFGIIRDAGTSSGVQNGATEECRYFDVPILPDAEVEEYFKRKADALLKHLADNTLPPICTDDERWWNEEYGTYAKCDRYCVVAEFCDRR
jgi:hypothetical protein